MQKPTGVYVCINGRFETTQRIVKFIFFASRNERVEAYTSNQKPTLFSPRGPSETKERKTTPSSAREKRFHQRALIINET